jgi:hypothetical protein
VRVQLERELAFQSAPGGVAVAVGRHPDHVRRSQRVERRAYVVEQSHEAVPVVEENVQDPVEVTGVDAEPVEGAAERGAAHLGDGRAGRQPPLRFEVVVVQVSVRQPVGLRAQPAQLVECGGHPAPDRGQQVDERAVDVERDHLHHAVDLTDASCPTHRAPGRGRLH